MPLCFQWEAKSVARWRASFLQRLKITKISWQKLKNTGRTKILAQNACYFSWSFAGTCGMYNLYRTTNLTNYVNELPKSFYPNGKNDNRKKKLIADRWSSYIILECFFQPNLTNEGFKERQGDPPNLHWWTMAYKFCRKNKNKNKKRYPKFGRPTYEGNRYNKIEIQLC